MTSATVVATGAVRSCVRADPRWRIAAVSVAVGAGHRADRDGTRGLAHLCEHLVMRHRPGAGAAELFSWVDAVGGIASAHTWPDHTIFTALVPPAEAGRAIRRFAAAVVADQVPPSVLAEEVGAISGEIHALGPTRGVPWGAAAAMLHGGDPTLADGYGHPAQLRALTVEQVRAFRRDRYVPGNMAVTVVGDIDPDRLAPIIAEAFTGPDLSTPGRYRASGAAAGRVRAGGTSVARLLAYPMPEAGRRLGDHLAILVLAAVVTRRLASAGHQGWLRAGWGGRPLSVRHDDLAVAHFPAGDPGAARRHLHRCLDELAARPAPAAERERAAERVRLDLRRRLDGPESYAAELSRTALLLPGTGTPAQVADQVALVTGADVSRAAAWLLATEVSP